VSPATVAGRPGGPDPDEPHEPVPSAAALDRRAREVLEANWRPPGFSVPNPASYPWQWLWDSCFHAVVWLHLGEADRAVTELTHALAHQAKDGFVPHMTYWSERGGADDPTHAAFWGRPATSSITQPPMHGHALAELHRAGVALPDELVERSQRGLRFLLDRRNRHGVGPVIVHPWESGCDDSPRWDGWSGPEHAWSPARAHDLKGELVGALKFTEGGSPVASAEFEVVAAGFAALVAFNARELASVTGDEPLVDAADAVASELDARWAPEPAVWADAVLVGPPSARGAQPVRVAEALLPVLVSADQVAVGSAFAQLVDPTAFGGRFGPAGVHRHEPTFDPGTYWRGAAWPQLAYLLWLAAHRRGHPVAPTLRDRLRAGAWRSGFAEYWDPDTGDAGGASPQSWTALAAVVD
jgi:hypothetical protein